MTFQGRLPFFGDLPSPRPVLLLMGARTARSVGQGALAANFILELKRVGWSAPAIGAVLSGGIIFSIAATLLLGPASDRYGRKPFLAGYEILQFLCALGGLLTENGSPSNLVLTLIAVVGGFGQATGGGAGAFSPVEQSWLSRLLPDTLRSHYFSLNTATGFFGMALGALSGLYPRFFPSLGNPNLLARGVFLTVMAGALLALILLLFVPDAPHSPTVILDKTLKDEWVLLRTLIGVNSLNGLSLGLYAPLMAYWFSLRFGRGPGSIGLAMAGGYLLAGIFSLASAPLTRRFGTVRTVIAGRGAGLVFTLLIPLMPTFSLAVLAHLLRVASNQGTIGPRQALSVSLVGEGRRGLAASLHNVSMQIPQSIGPTLGAALLSHKMTGMPFFLGALLQGGYLFFYYRAFEGFDRKV